MSLISHIRLFRCMCAVSCPRANKYNKSTTLTPWQSHCPVFLLLSSPVAQTHNATSDSSVSIRATHWPREGHASVRLHGEAESVCFWLIWRGAARWCLGAGVPSGAFSDGSVLIWEVRIFGCVWYGPNTPDRLGWKLLSMFSFKSSRHILDLKMHTKRVRI